MKLTIITITLNAEKTILDTINSLISQDYPTVEYIIVDGGSTDSTIELISSSNIYEAVIVSEKDSGIYDAMNKGIALATGDIIGFLNSDDIYADVNVLSLVAGLFMDKRVDACYGDLVYVDADNIKKNVRTWHSGSFDRKKMFNGWMPPHPTFFVRRDCYLRNGFYRTDLGSSADYELMLRYILCCKINVTYIPCTLVKMRTGGVSNVTFKNRLKAHFMDWKAWSVNGLTPYPWTLPFKPLRKLLQWI